MRSADAGSSGAVGREQQNRPVVEVVREEDDEIERRRIGPVQILEHEQHGCGSGALGEQRERLLEHLQLRARRPVDLPRLPERTQGLDERLVRQLRADEIDRAPDEAPRTRRRGRDVASSDASRVLPMPASPATRTVVPLPACAASSARSSSPSSRARPTNAALARAPCASIARHPLGSARSTRPKIRRPTAKDKALRPMRSRSSRPRSTIRAEEQRMTAGTDQREDRADEGSHSAGRRRPAAARARVGQTGRAADPVHSRLVAEPPLLGEAVRERARRRVPARCLRPPRSRHVRGAARARALHRRQALGRRRGGDHRRAGASTGRCSSAGRTAPSSSATTCARTARIASRRSTSSRARSSWARRPSAR